MSCFEKIGNTISSKSKELARKAKTVSETSSLNNIIRAEERKIDTQYKMMGKIYFEKFGNSPDEDFSSSIDAIKTSMEKITETKNEIVKIKNRNCCPNCGSHFKIDAVFCSKCGTRVKNEEEDKQEIAYNCLNCGHLLELGALFCDICGAKAEINEAVEQPESENESTDIIEKTDESEEVEESENNDITKIDIPEVKICSSCGAESEDPEAKFCNECGNSL